MAQNSRFVILPGFQGVPNPASRVLGLSLRRLSGDMQREHGFPILLAESFVDRALFAGTCFQAAENGRELRPAVERTVAAVADPVAIMRDLGQAGPKWL